MITDATNEWVVKLIGLSTDTKPLIADLPYMANGSEFKEIDTSKYYIYDKDTNAWVLSDANAVPETY